MYIYIYMNAHFVTYGSVCVLFYFYLINADMDRSDISIYCTLLVLKSRNQFVFVCFQYVHVLYTNDATEIL